MAAAAQVSGCAPALELPSGSHDRIVAGDGFRHRAITRAHPGSGLLHIYIEGDGRAWLSRTTISRDPTPSRPLMLELMGLDPGASAFVGRPCYFGLAESPDCEPRHWTTERYSAEVVASLGRVIEDLVAEGNYDGLVLFGHSGGGTLATLLAERLPGVRALVTIGANLDVAGWAAIHGFSPLSGSLDPGRVEGFPGQIFQVHWIGAKDDNVPPELLADLVPSLGGELREIEGFDHSCCWAEIWPDQLDELNALFREPTARVYQDDRLNGVEENLP